MKLNILILPVIKTAIRKFPVARQAQAKKANATKEYASIFARRGKGAVS